MEESYLISKLIIGNTTISSNLGGTRGPIQLTSMETFIFYETSENNFNEVFTNDQVSKIDDDKYLFDKKYIINSTNIYSCLSEDEINKEVISKYRLQEIYKVINSKNKSSHYQKQLQK